MAREGMSDLILRLRAMSEAGTAEYTLGATTYFTDDQLQAMLDRRREDHRRMRMMPVSEYSSGTLIYKNYYYEARDVERASDDTTVWRVEDAAGSAIGTATYTANYDSQYIRFANNTGGSAYYLTCREYDLERTAADVWEQKASNVANRFDIKTDNHDLKRSQLRASYLQMAQMHKKRAKPKSSRFSREDVW